ncbi:MAG TPA: hypothetical protein VKY85_21420 [Candidatus Angelobacter sp.]|nr:hypothetical protein [Candidatus Angelobacter sp.]
MIAYSTREAAKKLGITEAALSRYIKAGKVPMPKIVQIGRMKLHSWSESDIEHLRELLPKIANGRKTWRQKKQKQGKKKQQKKKSKP